MRWGCYERIKRARSSRDPECIADGGRGAAGGECAGLAAETAATTTNTVRFGSWGVDLGARDLKAKPGDDFEHTPTAPGWTPTEIPADQSSERRRLRSLRPQPGADSGDRHRRGRGQPARRLLRQLYERGRLEERDGAPLKADLARVAALQPTRTSSPASWATPTALIGSTLFGAGRAARSRRTRR